MRMSVERPCVGRDAKRDTAMRIQVDMQAAEAGASWGNRQAALGQSQGNWTATHVTRVASLVQPPHAQPLDLGRVPGTIDMKMRGPAPRRTRGSEWMADWSGLATLTSAAAAS